MVANRMGWDWLMGFMKYGKEWRDSRKLFTKHLSPSNNGMHQYYESKYIPRLLQQLLKKPGGFVDHLRQYGFHFHILFLSRAYHERF